MENLFNVEFFQYDRRGKVVDRRMKKDVTIVFRRCSNSYEITIKARNTQDLFVTKEILLSDSNDERVVSIDLPERRFVLTITADEIAIQSLKDSICDCTGSIEDNTAAITGSANKIRDRVGSINKLQSCGLHLSKSALRSPTATSTSGTSTASVTANCIDSVVSSATNGLSPAAKRVNTKTTPVCLRARDKFHHDDRDSNSRRDNNERKSREGIVKPIKRLNYASKESEDKENRTNTSSQSRSLPNDLLDTLTVQQLEILDQCRNKNNIFYSGGAGTGKSHLLAAIIAEMKLLHGADTVHVTATTGLAACAIGGITIHQFAGISAISEGISDKEIDNMIEKLKSREYLVRRWKTTKVILLDEVSMMSPRLLEVLNKVAKSIRNTDKPMGGIQFICTGDFFQLPPVQNYRDNIDKGSTANKYTNSLTIFGFYQKDTNESSQQSLQNRKGGESRMYCFQSPDWNEIIQQKFELHKIFRQDGDENLAQILTAIRFGRPLTNERAKLLSNCVGRQFDCSDGILPTQIFTHKREVDSLNEAKLKQLEGEEQVFESLDSGTSSSIQMISSNCPAKQTIKLKIGAQVILVKNINNAEGLVNGARGVVVKFNKMTRLPVVRFVGSDVEREMSREPFTISIGNSIIAERLQLPLDLSWGISVHKAQGMTVDKAILDLKNVFEYGQAYVALSRVRGLEGLSLRHPLQASQIKAHPAVIQFYEDLQRCRKVK